MGAEFRRICFGSHMHLPNAGARRDEGNDTVDAGVPGIRKIGRRKRLINWLWQLGVDPNSETLSSGTFCSDDPPRILRQPIS